MGALVGLLLPAIPGLINLAEALIRKKTPEGQPVKTGTDKADLVLQALRAIIAKYTASTGFAEPITDDMLKGLIESVFQTIGPTGAALTPAARLYVLQGSITELKSA